MVGKIVHLIFFPVTTDFFPRNFPFLFSPSKRYSIGLYGIWCGMGFSRTVFIPTFDGALGEEGED
jgi:hypothetical protein